MSRSTWSRLLLAVMTAGCSGSQRTTPPILSATVDASGGTLEVSSGPLKGVKVVIPPKALPQPTQLAIVPGLATDQPGFLVTWRAVRLTPAGLRFDLPVTITLPFPQPDGSGEIVILAQTQTNQVIELGPATVAPNGGAVTVTTAELATVWPAERYFYASVPTTSFLPLDDGNVWTFDNGVTATVTQTANEPNLNGETVTLLQFTRDQQRLGFYLEYTDTASIGVKGEFAVVGGDGYQQLHATTLFLPVQVIIHQVVQADHTFVGYTPYGSTTQAYAGTARVQMSTQIPASVTTPVGLFDDLLRVYLTTTLTQDNGAQGTVSLVLTLARAKGLVAVQAFGLDGFLTSGTVRGRPVTGK